MQIVDCLQGSAEWLAARRGIPTASRFGDIVSPLGKVREGQTPRTYALELVGERLTGSAQNRPETWEMARGKELEARARAWYSLASGNAVYLAGFVVSNCGRWGASPDGLTETGGIEIKCPGRVAMLETLITRVMAPDYAVQTQACMWVCGRSHWDFVLWTDEPGIPNAWWRVDRDEALHAVFSRALPAFCDEVDALEAAVRAQDR